MICKTSPASPWSYHSPGPDPNTNLNRNIGGVHVSTRSTEVAVSHTIQQHHSQVDTVWSLEKVLARTQNHLLLLARGPLVSVEEW